MPGDSIGICMVSLEQSGKRHFHKVMTKCVAVTAYKRGYVMKPMSMFTDMNAVEAIDISIEVCDCTIGYWGKEPICREALEKNDPSILVQAIAN